MDRVLRMDPNDSLHLLSEPLLCLIDLLGLILANDACLNDDQQDLLAFVVLDQQSDCGKWNGMRRVMILALTVEC